MVMGNVSPVENLKLGMEKCSIPVLSCGGGAMITYNCANQCYFAALERTGCHRNVVP